MAGRDLTAFSDDNAYWRGQRKRIPWEDRVERIDREFPSARNADWNVILRDNDVLARVLKDILKVDQIEPGRAGPRPNLNRERGMQSWRELTGQDYSEAPFPQAFRELAKGQSCTTIGRKASMNRVRVWRLMNGVEHPTVEDLRLVAEAFGKKPAYFAEYRSEYIMAMIASRLTNAPEMSIAIYRNLVKQ